MIEVSVYNVYITNQFQTTFAQEGGVVNPRVEVTVNSKEENSEDFCPIYVQEFVLCPQNIVKYINKTDANHRIC